MRTLFVSDLHYELDTFRGVDESVAWEWLLGVVERESPDCLLCAGDWGTAVTPSDFERLFERIPPGRVLGVYGNHENVPVLEAAGVLLPEGRVVDVCGLRVAGVHGVINLKVSEKRGVPRRRPEDFYRLAIRLSHRHPDVLILHEVVPIVEVYAGKITFHDYLSVVMELVERVKPRLVLNGHVHRGCFTYHEFSWGGRYLRVDSSQLSKCYAVLEVRDEEVSVAVKRDGEETFTFSLSL